MNYLARGPHCWGKGKTREEAVQNAKLNFPRGYLGRGKRIMDKHFSIYTSAGEFTVDDEFGQIRSTVDDIKQTQKSCLAN